MANMKKNMGSTDRFIRMPLGILIIMAGLYFESWWGATGLILVATSFVGICPIYSILGISTRKKEAQV